MPMYNKSGIAAEASKHGFQRDVFEKVLRLKICYAGLVAHMMLGRKDVGNVVWVDYRRYVSGEK